MEENYRRSSAGNVVENFGVIADDVLHAAIIWRIVLLLGLIAGFPEASRRGCD
jgi:hypothetical protein